MGQRRVARELGLQLLYAIDITALSLQETLENFACLELKKKPQPGDFTIHLLEKTLLNLAYIDSLLQKVITNWRLDRLSSIDKNILRLATSELLHFDDIPPKVTINEYIEIAKVYGDIDSPSFINGILDKIARNSTHKLVQKDSIPH